MDACQHTLQTYKPLTAIVFVPVIVAWYEA